ncbi:hypothetical protein ACFQ7W_23620 [Streptomyces niveus]|uniref:hypothetical protein n=1 Tax=Streptomyces niveus TaxID=193462 RepID=UPI0036A8FE46
MILPTGTPDRTRLYGWVVSVDAAVYLTAVSFDMSSVMVSVESVPCSAASQARSAVCDVDMVMGWSVTAVLP